MFTLWMRSVSLILLFALTISVGAQAAQPTSRIVGGSIVSDERYPFIVAVMFDLDGDGNFAHGCGGTLISDSWVLTAAHCIVDAQSGQLLDFNSVAVLVGSLDIFDQTQGTLIASQRVVAHPTYQAQTFTNDIAVIELAQAVEVPVIALPATGSDVPQVSEDAVVAGWGNTMEAGLKSRLLRQVTLPIISHTQCLPFYASSLGSSANVCAGGAAATGRDSCQGDSGGPLFVLRDEMFVQAGIVSFGEGCARPDIPGVYTRLSSYTDWVASVVPGIVINNSGLGTTEPDQPLNNNPLLLQLTIAAPLQSGSLIAGEVAVYEITGSIRVELLVSNGDADLIVSEGDGFEVENVICRSENRVAPDFCDLPESAERRFAIVYAYAPSDFDIRVVHADNGGGGGTPPNDSGPDVSSADVAGGGFLEGQWVLLLGGLVLFRRYYIQQN